MDVAKYRQTQRGRYKLVHNNYEYYKTDKYLEGAQAWRCIRFNRTGANRCLVRAYTKNVGMIDKVKINGEHNHRPNRF